MTGIQLIGQGNSPSTNIIDGVDIPEYKPSKTISCYNELPEIVWTEFNPVFDQNGKVESVPQEKSIRGEQFELTGTIINKISSPPHCGTIAWGTVVEFKVLKYSDLKYKADKIAVIFTCPEFYKANFLQVGHTYKLIVANENQADFGWSIPNDSILKKYNLDKRLWVITAEKVK